ncbi:MAG: hypothetical protein OJJ54_21550 [Pseudonocardia sp.]|nr:hypothetical protein [Pseudonocardia sp.]
MIVMSRRSFALPFEPLVDCADAEPEEGADHHADHHADQVEPIPEAALRSESIWPTTTAARTPSF